MKQTLTTECFHGASLLGGEGKNEWLENKIQMSLMLDFNNWMHGLGQETYPLKQWRSGTWFKYRFHLIYCLLLH
jgi:hypothetical protein